MATRSDQLHSYQFMIQRVISAFVMRETDPRQSPLRRGIGAVFGGIMIAVLVAAGFGVYGIFTKVGGNNWQSPGSVVIEKETGASFIFLNGALHPTLNYASAMLAAGRANPPVFRVASNSLGSVPRGVTIGIPGAPNSLPPAGKRVGLPWTVCAIPGTDSAGHPTDTVVVTVSLVPTTGQVLSEQGVLVEDAKSGVTYLIWHGQRHLVRSAETVVPALFGTATPVPVGTAWLNSLAAGVDIGLITVPGRGTPSTRVPDREVGDVLVAQTGSGPQYYLVFDDGLAPVTQLQKDILGGTGSPAPVPVELSLVNAAPRSARVVAPSGDNRPPPAAPALVVPGRSDPVCAVTAEAAAPPVVRVGGSMSGLDEATPTESTSPDGVPLADRVLVPAGRVAVIRVLGVPDAYFVLTDAGIKYPLPTPTVLPLLGYSPGQAIDVPARLVNRLPSGPALDPLNAILPAPVSGAN